jgi:hypothetical protein
MLSWRAIVRVSFGIFQRSSRIACVHGPQV